MINKPQEIINILTPLLWRVVDNLDNFAHKHNLEYRIPKFHRICDYKSSFILKHAWWSRNQ